MSNLGWQKNTALPLGDLPDGLAGCTIGNLINLAVESKGGPSAAMFSEINFLRVIDKLQAQSNKLLAITDPLIIVPKPS